MRVGLAAGEGPAGDVAGECVQRLAESGSDGRHGSVGGGLGVQEHARGHDALVGA